MTGKIPHGGYGKPGLILLAEDEPALRKLVTLVLEGKGYEVISFASGLDAASWVESDPQPFDLLITDIKIPGLSGKDLAERICAFRPDTRILFISGMSEYEVAELNPCANKEGFFLHKPFLPKDLLAAVAKILSPGQRLQSTGAEAG